MGNYAKNISKRIDHTKITTGYCLICGEYKKLSQDHVPPQGAITISKIEQKLIGEAMGERSPDIRGVVSKNGSKFKTICKDCNSKLGEFDSEITRVCAILTPIVKNYFQTATDMLNVKRIEIDAISYMRAMIGHVLSATTVKECEEPQRHSPYFTPLIQFVLGDNDAINTTHDIYYWFYPYKRHLSAKIIFFYNEGNSCCLSLLSFFPIAFLITEKNKGVYPVHAQKLTTESNSLILDLSSHNINYVNFPFVNLVGNQFYMMSDQVCTMSYPIGQ
ncbi:hypothetical protein ACK3Z9_12190 [Aeromonas caviae]